jgi:hypothetical protein
MDTHTATMPATTPMIIMTVTASPSIPTA